jgi:hypothetical protein
MQRFVRTVHGEPSNSSYSTTADLRAGGLPELQLRLAALSPGIRRPFCEHSIQLPIVPVYVVEEVYRAVLIYHGSDV